MENRQNAFEIIANSSPVALYIHDGKKFLFCNQGAVDLVEESSIEEVLAKPSILSYVHRDFHGLITERTIKRMQGLEVENDYEVKVITAKGNEKWIEMHIEVGEYKGQKALVGTAIDISEKKKAGQTVQKSKDDFQFLAEASAELLKTKGRSLYDVIISRLGQIAPDAFIVLNQWDPAKRTLSVMRHFGAGGILKIVHKVVPDAFINHSWNPIQKTLNDLSKGKLLSIDISYLPPKTGKFSYETIMLLKKLTKVEDYYMIGLVHDNSLFGSINIFLRRGADKLNKNLIETFANTAAIAIHRMQLEEELHKARIEAEFASRVKSQFLSNMSHEIRTPLNGIVGMIEILKDTALDEEQKKFLDLGKESSKTLLLIIDDILDYSKIESGKMELHRYNFNLYNRIKTTVSIFEHSAKAKGLELRFDIDPAVPEMIFGDELAIGRVLNNLISNAIKFTAQGKVELSVMCKNCLDDERMIIFEVADTGIGINQDQTGLLFKRFSQLDTGHKKQFKGTGLGLAISKGLVELMGGEISVRSTPGKGSVFSFYISHK